MSDDIHEPMEVRRVDGRAVPPLDQSWDNLTKLRWHAGIVLSECGVQADITTNCFSQPRWFGLFGPQRFRRDVYGIAIGNGTTVGFDFDGAWDFLNGVEEGAKAARS